MRAIGIIFAIGNTKRMRELSGKRSNSAMPMAGGYRSIDFALSSMTNSGIKTVAVLTQYASRSLNTHLNSSKWWDFGRKQGGLYVFNPTITADHAEWYKGGADALWQNIDFLKDSHEPYVVIADGTTVFKTDLNKILEYHIEKKADITVVTGDMPAGDDPSRFCMVETDPDGRITEFEDRPIATDRKRVSCGIFVIRRRNLIEYLENSDEEGRADFIQDILIRYRKVKRIYSYDIDSYWSNIASVESYYRTNMDFLRPEVRYFFNSEPAVMTKVDDLPPAKYNPGSSVKNALVADGCIINGRVENSLLFKDVYVGNNCLIKNSIVLNNVYIADNTVLENCIVESRDVIGSDSHYAGTPEDPKIVIVKHDRYAGR